MAVGNKPDMRLYLVSDIMRATGLAESTVLTKIRNGEFGKYRRDKNTKNGYLLVDNAIELYLAGRVDARGKRRKEMEKSAPASKKSSPPKPEFILVPSLSREDAKAKAERSAKKYVDEHCQRMDTEDREKTYRHKYKMYFERYSSLKHRVPTVDASDSDLRAAYEASLFLAAHVDMLAEDDASFFLSKWDKYTRFFGSDGTDPIMESYIIQLIDAEIMIRRRSSALTMAGVTAKRDLEESLKRAQESQTKIVEVLMKLRKTPLGGEEETPPKTEPLGERYAEHDGDDINEMGGMY